MSFQNEDLESNVVGSELLRKTSNSHYCTPLIADFELIQLCLYSILKIRQIDANQYASWVSEIEQLLSVFFCSVWMVASRRFSKSMRLA